MGIPMLKIRRSWDHLIFNMGIPILVRHLYTERAPWWMHKEFATPGHTLVLMNPYPVGVTDEPTWGAPVVSRQEPPVEYYHLTTGSPTECCFMSFLPGMVSVSSMIHHNIILTHWGWNKMVDVLQVSFSLAFTGTETFEFQTKFYRNMFCRMLLTLCQRWFR